MRWYTNSQLPMQMFCDTLSISEVSDEKFQILMKKYKQKNKKTFYGRGRQDGRSDEDKQTTFIFIFLALALRGVLTQLLFLNLNFSFFSPF